MFVLRFRGKQNEGYDPSECHTQSHAPVLWRRRGEVVNQRSLFDIAPLCDMKVKSKETNVLIGFGSSSDPGWGCLRSEMADDRKELSEETPCPWSQESR